MGRQLKRKMSGSDNGAVKSTSSLPKRSQQSLEQLEKVKEKIIYEENTILRVDFDKRSFLDTQLSLLRTSELALNEGDKYGCLKVLEISIALSEKACDHFSL